MRTEIDERRQSILRAIMEDYIVSAVPVGSVTLERRYFPHLSSATIRNEMSFLSEMGYLQQPHVSAGRIPTDLAYRFYVDELIREEVEPLPNERFAADTLSTRRSQLEDLLPAAAQVLSDLTHMTALIMLPKQQELRIRCLQLIPMLQSTALLVVITESGQVSQNVVRVNDMLDADSLYSISRMLTERLSGHTLSEVQMLLSRISRTGGDSIVLEGIRQMAAQMEKQASDDSIVISGRHNILNYPEYSDMNKARAFLSVLDDKERLLQLLRYRKEHLSVHIGLESGIPEFGDCSVATYRYTSPGRHNGTVSVIGPVRMPYEYVLRALVTVGNALTEMIGAQ